MTKKLLNYGAIFLFVLSLVVPSLTFAGGGVSMNSTVANITSGDSAWSNSVNAKAGDQIAFSTKVFNETSAPITGLSFHVQLPSALQYVNGTGKLYYKDTATNADASVSLPDSIMANGASILDIPSTYFVYVAYKTTVASGIAAGTYAPGNQVFNSGGLNVSTNNASVVVTSGTTNPQTTVSATIVSALYNLTKGETGYSVSTSANPGDEIMYRVKLTNTGTATLTGLNTRIQLPSAFEYVPNYSRAIYTVNGVDQTVALNDTIIGNGSTLPVNVSVGNYIYIVYKVRVASNAVLGTYGTGNQVWGDGNLNVSANDATVIVSGVKPAKSLSLNATAYDATTAANTAYANSVNANRGDLIGFRLAIANTGSEVLKNAKITSILPANMEYVAKSVKVVINGNKIDVPDNGVISLGDLNVGASGVIEFSAKVKSDTPANTEQLVYTANGTADNVAQVSSVVNIYLASVNQLPSTGTPTSVISLIILAMFISIASYMYLKESNALKGAVKLIKR